MVECAGFENRSARKGRGSSNLPLSVIGQQQLSLGGVQCATTTSINSAFERTNKRCRGYPSAVLEIGVTDFPRDDGAVGQGDIERLGLYSKRLELLAGHHAMYGSGVKQEINGDRFSTFPEWLDRQSLVSQPHGRSIRPATPHNNAGGRQA